MTTDTTIRRRFKLGTWDRQSMFINAEVDDAGELHITGDIYRSGQDVGGGQCLADARKIVRRGNLLIDPQQAVTLLSTWKRWHLNHLRAGCEHQRAMGWDIGGYDAHPSQPCPTCGYKYGSAWLKEELPADVIAFIASLPGAA